MQFCLENIEDDLNQNFRGKTPAYLSLSSNTEFGQQKLSVRKDNIKAEDQIRHICYELDINLSDCNIGQDLIKRKLCFFSTEFQKKTEILKY